MRARRVAALAAVAVVVALTPAAAESKRFVEYVLVDIRVGADAVVHVNEVIGLDPNTLLPAVLRTIPLRTPDGRLVRVRDVDAAVPIRVTEREDVVEVRLRGSLTLGDQGGVRYGLRYTVYRGLRSGPDTDVLEWSVLPNDSHGHVKNLRVDVHLPPSVPPRSRVQARLTGRNGEELRANVIHGHGLVRLEALGPVDPYARLTVTWPSGHVDFATAEPPMPWPWPFRPSSEWIVPGALLLLTGLVWMGEQYAGRRAVMPVYGPPAGLRPGEAGVVIDGRIDPEDIVAAVVDLALRGYLTLERASEETDWIVSVRRPWISDRDLRPWEGSLLVSVFTAPGISSIALSALRTPRESHSIHEALSAELAARGLFSSGPVVVRRAGRWVAVIVTAVWMQITWNEAAGLSTAVAGLATGVALWLLAGALAAGGLSAEGWRARQTLRGFREFLLRVDKPRLERLRPGTLDENLPWAIALGVTESWLAATPQPASRP